MEGEPSPRCFLTYGSRGIYEEYSLDVRRAGSDVAFVCYPHGEAHPAVAELLDAGCRVVDLSADFRLKDPQAYTGWYGFAHPRPDLRRRGRIRPPGNSIDGSWPRTPGGQSRLLPDGDVVGLAARGDRHR